MVEESGQFAAENCVLWASQTSHHDWESDTSTVVIGKGISATGSTLRYDMPQEKTKSDRDHPPPCPGLNVRPHYATQLRLNSRGELLVKLDHTDYTGWVNVTPEGGLREGVSELHLVAGCYSYDNNNCYGFSEMSTSIEVWSLHSCDAFKGSPGRFSWPSITATRRSLQLTRSMRRLSKRGLPSRAWTTRTDVGIRH